MCASILVFCFLFCRSIGVCWFSFCFVPFFGSIQSLSSTFFLCISCTYLVEIIFNFFFFLCCFNTILQFSFSYIIATTSTSWLLLLVTTLALWLLLHHCCFYLALKLLPGHNFSYSQVLLQSRCSYLVLFISSIVFLVFSFFTLFMLFISLFIWCVQVFFVFFWISLWKRLCLNQLYFLINC